MRGLGHRVANTRALPLVLASASLIVGCLGAAVPPEADDALATQSADVSLAGFGLELKGCIEGGGVSTYPTDDGATGPVEPFKLADTRDDIGGDVTIGSSGVIPPGSATWGIWHISLECDSYTYQGEERGAIEWGWVGVKIHPPEWDTSGIERQFFVADLSFPDEDILKELQGKAVHASTTWGAKIEWLAPGVMHTVLDDEEHGVFETHSKMKDYRALETQPIRFWMLVATDGSHEHGGGSDASAATTYKAISFDLVDNGGEKHLVSDTTGFLTHTRTDAHGAVPGAGGTLQAVLYTGFDRTIAFGPSPDLVFEKTWTH